MAWPIILRGVGLQLIFWLLNFASHLFHLLCKKKSAGCLTNKTGPVHWKCFFHNYSLSLSLLTLIIFSAKISNAATTSARKNKQNNAAAANILTFDASSLSASSSGLCRQHQHGMCQGIDVITQFTREVPRYCFQAHKAKKNSISLKKFHYFSRFAQMIFKN